MTLRREVVGSTIAIVRNELGAPELALGLDTEAREIEGWDSVAMVSVILAVEARYGFEFDAAEMDRMASISDFVERILLHLERGTP